jgi:hypothetical protein
VLRQLVISVSLEGCVGGFEDLVVVVYGGFTQQGAESGGGISRHDFYDLEYISRRGNVSQLDRRIED